MSITRNSTKQKTTINLVYGSVLLLFFLGLIMFGPNELPQYKHSLIAIISSILVGIFGFFFTGEIGIRISSKLLENKIGKIALQATGGIALFVVSMIWWRSPLAPIEKIQESIIKEQQKSVDTTLKDRKSVV